MVSRARAFLFGLIDLGVENVDAEWDVGSRAVLFTQLEPCFFRSRTLVSFVDGRLSVGYIAAT
jgi:hypothetical protein